MSSSRRPARRYGAVLLAGSLAAATICAVVPAGAATPSPDDVRRQQATAQRLQGQARSEADHLGSEQGRLAALAAAANLALDRSQQAREQLLAAVERLRVERERLAAARAAVAAAQEALGRYAALAYQSGGVEPGLGALHALLDAHPGDLAAALQYLSFAGEGQAAALAVLRSSEGAERRAAADAARSAADRRAAERHAAAARAEADTAVAEQRTLVARLDTRLRSTRTAASEATRRAAALARARRVALERERQARLAQARVGGSAPRSYVGGCTGRSLGGYANGRLPTSALCPLWGAAGQLLRADAATTFSRMSMAYAAQFGAPICVTDSYRSYASQVRLYREKPALAAYPGTSEHGWGRATDLCGGIQSFGTTTHNWMVANAPRFGWFHPGWAEPGGSRPEPWHFEYGR